MSASTSTSVDKSIRAHLLSLQNSFFQSLQIGTDAVLTAFHQDMVAFNETLSHCLQDVQEETYLLIHSFVQMSNAVIPELIDLDIASEKINQKLTEEIANVFNELSLNDFTILGKISLLFIMPPILTLALHMQNQKHIHHTFNQLMPGFWTISIIPILRRKYAQPFQKKPTLLRKT